MFIPKGEIVFSPRVGFMVPKRVERSVVEVDAAALAAAFLVAALIKCGWLSRLLGARVDGWRPSLAFAAAIALPAGLLAMQFDGFVSGVAGLFLVLAVFGTAIWLIGYRGSDRLLFAARNG